MEIIYSVYEMGTWEFWGTYAECQEYIARNNFQNAFFTIEEC
jgi:hypothetical protein